MLLLRPVPQPHQQNVVIEAARRLAVVVEPRRVPTLCTHHGHVRGDVEVAHLVGDLRLDVRHDDCATLRAQRRHRDAFARLVEAVEHSQDGDGVHVLLSGQGRPPARDQLVAGHDQHPPEVASSHAGPLGKVAQELERAPPALDLERERCVVVPHMEVGDVALCAEVAFVLPALAGHLEERGPHTLGGRPEQDAPQAHDTARVRVCAGS